MCTSIIEVIPAEGMGKRGEEWFSLSTAVVAYDHARHAPLGDVITLDFINVALDPGARAAQPVFERAPFGSLGPRFTDQPRDVVTSGRRDLERRRRFNRTRGFEPQEATEIGLDWLFEDTLVMPEDFGTAPATEPGVDFDFDAAERDILAR